MPTFLIGLWSSWIAPRAWLTMATSPTAMHQAVQALTGLSYEQRDGLVTVRGKQILASLPSEQRASPAVKEFRDLLMLTAKNGRKAR